VTDKATAMRRARMSLARESGRHTPLQWEVMKAALGSRCCRCGRSDCNIEKDHIVPIYAGGSDAIENIQPSCARCNASKGPEAIDHRPSDWRQLMRDFRLEI
jgi:5-methylcytosine-specific restriction endonuclease McrA